MNNKLTKHQQEEMEAEQTKEAAVAAVFHLMMLKKHLVKGMPGVSLAAVEAEAQKVISRALSLIITQGTVDEIIDLATARIVEMETPKPDPLPDHSDIRELGLLSRYESILRREGVNTVGQLCAHETDAQLLKYRALGSKALSEIKAKLLRFGRSMGDNVPPLGPSDKPSLTPETHERNYSGIHYVPPLAGGAVSDGDTARTENVAEEWN